MPQPAHRRATLGCLAGAVLVLTAGPVGAQSVSPDAALDARLAAAEMQVAQLAGRLGVPDLADPALVPAQSQLPGTYAAEVEIRLSQLESRLSQLNGRLEELQFAVSQSEQRLDRALNDIEFRLIELEGGDPFATTGGGSPVATPPAGGAAGQPTNVIGGTDTTTVVDPSTGVLGTLTLTPGSGGQVAADPASASYDAAFALLQRADYGGAEQALTSFLADYPQHPLASNAHYWLGETFYVRGRFQEAAGAFARGYQAFPQGAKAVDSLLKLGMSLAQLGQRNEACLTFEQLAREFPNAALAIQRRAEQEQQRLAC